MPGRRTSALACAVLIALASLGPEICRAASVGPAEAITRPSKDVTLSFIRVGRIAKILVKEGDTVKAGQLLVQMDDEAERAELGQLEAQAKDDTHIRAAQAKLSQKKVDRKRAEWLLKQGAGISALEVEHKRLDVTIADLELKLAEFRHKQAQRKFQEVTIQVDRMRLVSPIAGKVEKIFVEPGESADGLQEVIRVVQTDPLRIEVPVPTKQARQLRRGQTARVEFGEGEQKLEGKITHIAAVADSASQTLTVRVELHNPAGRPAGERVMVHF